MIEDEIMEDISDWAREEASDWAREAAKKIIEPSEKIQRENQKHFQAEANLFKYPEKGGN